MIHPRQAIHETRKIACGALDATPSRPHDADMLGLDGFDDEAEEQARFFEERVPVYANALRAFVRLIAAEPAVRVCAEAAWGARKFHARYERPLLFCAALRYDALASPDHPLAGALGVGGEASVEVSALRRALAPGAAAWRTLKTRYVQTNEVTRAIAWRLPYALLPPGAPVVLVDLGCSAGLNLVADRLDLQWIDERSGSPFALIPTSAIVARVGLDRAPIDAREPAEHAWLRACLWPGQTDRLARLDAALVQAETALRGGEIELVSASATEMPANLERLAEQHPKARILAFHTIFAEYLTPGDRTAFDLAMSAWLRRHPRRAIWVAFESAPRGSPGPADLRVRLADEAFVVASGDYHPRSLVVENAELEALALALGAPSGYPG